MGKKLKPWRTGNPASLSGSLVTVHYRRKINVYLRKQRNLCWKEQACKTKAHMDSVHFGLSTRTFTVHQNLIRPKDSQLWMCGHTSGLKKDTRSLEFILLKSHVGHMTETIQSEFCYRKQHMQFLYVKHKLPNFLKCYILIYIIFPQLLLVLLVSSLS